MAEDDEKKISKFSSGINILQRVDNLWKNCHAFKRDGFYYKWNEELDSVWLELARDLKPEEYYDLGEKNKILRKEDYFKEDNGKLIFDSEKYNKEVKKIGYLSQFEAFEQKLSPLMPFTDSGSVGFQQPTGIDMQKRNKQYKILMDKQLFLARLENEIGKGTSWEEEDDDF